jgi:nickel-type superoxide dismutase maturation protease
MFHLGLHKIQGVSMLPVFKPNDFVFSLARYKSRYQVNDVVIVEHPLLGKIIKRIKSLEKNHVRLVGDNLQQSTTTDAIGSLPINLIKGRVVWHIRANLKALG